MNLKNEKIATLFSSISLSLLAYSILYSIYYIYSYIKAMLLNEEFFINDLRFDSIFNGIFATKYLNVFWFFIPLFCIYLCIPLFACHQKKQRKFLPLLHLCKKLYYKYLQMFDCCFSAFRTRISQISWEHVNFRKDSYS